ncbi:MAG: DNA recombination protein RmuC [Thermoleophilaceae bacterium]|nr:DNA recombination protein RmuC [Thermoleophilaceae bacterium]
MEIALLAVAVIAILALAAYIIFVQPRAEAQRSAALFAQLERDRAAHEKELEIRLLESQSAVAQKQTESFLNLAKSHLKQETELGEQQLKARQQEIDKGLENIRTELKGVREFVTNTDKARVESFGQIAEAVKQSREATQVLQQNTQKLNEALSGSQSRGAWGEHVAEDVLRIAGFIEGVNYRKQQTTAEGSRPDFTFLLPDQRTLNMDVKMPMAAFNRYLEADTDPERDAAAKEFLRDTKSRIKEVTTRDYINPSEGTLDYTLVFIPNEQIYGFIHEQDASIINFALQNHVVICSPLTLFAVLAVIRQSADNFRLESKTREIQGAIGDFRAQWEKYKEQTQGVQRAFNTANKQWQDLTGVRERQLDKSIEKIDGLRSGSDQLAAPDVEPEVLSLLSADDN